MMAKIKSKKLLQETYDTKFKPKKRAETALEKKKRVKKELAQDDERLAEIGQESESKGIKFAKEDFKAQQILQKEEITNEVEWLTSRRRFRDEDYLIALASILWQRMRGISWPIGYRWEVDIDGRKIRATVKSPTKREYAKGFVACGEAKFDHNAAEKTAIEAENTLDHLEKSLEGHKTSSGILIP